MRAFETLSQLASNSSAWNNQTFSACAIQSSPRFSHRALMVDIARYFFNASFILHTLDAMSYNSLSVLHLHATDAQSFPLELPGLEYMASYGAFPPHQFGCPYDNCTLSAADLKNIVDRAHALGIRVILELDTPGHTLAWSASPQLAGVSVRSCYVPILFNKDSVPMDPTNATTNTTIRAVWKAAIGGQEPLFPDKFAFLGGDEVDFDCWKDTPHVAKWLQQQSITPQQAQAQLVATAQSAVASQGRVPMQWEDVLQPGAVLEPSTVIAVWRNATKLLPVSRDSGYRTVLSAGWYLSGNLVSPSKWFDFYGQDPFDGSGWTEASKKQVLGGEVSKWGCSGLCLTPTTADDFDYFVWPTASAVAEVLWSDLPPNRSANSTEARDAYGRLVAQAERMQARGIASRMPASLQA